MADAAFVFATLLFFGVAWLYTVGCEHLQERP